MSRLTYELYFLLDNMRHGLFAFYTFLGGPDLVPMTRQCPSETHTKNSRIVTHADPPRLSTPARTRTWVERRRWIRVDVRGTFSFAISSIKCHSLILVQQAMLLAMKLPQHKRGTEQGQG